MRAGGIAAILLAASAGGCAGTGWIWQPIESIHRPRAADHPKAHAVVIAREVKLAALKSKYSLSSRALRHEVVAILDEGGFKHADVRIHMSDDDALLLLKARTIAPDGRVQEVTPAEVHENMAQGSSDTDRRKVKTHIFRLPNIAVGSVLEYVYEVESPRLRPWGIERMSSDLPTQHYHLEVSASEGINIALKAYNVKTDFQRTKDSDGTRVTLDVANIAAAPDEPFSPPWQWTDPWWGFRVRAVGVFDWNDAWPGTLKEVAQRLYFEQQKYLEKAELKPESADCNGDRRCLVERAVAFVRDRVDLTEFVGSLARPRPLREVLAGGQANNFEKALLLYGTLGAEKVDARFALVARDFGLGFDHDFPLPQSFDHLMVFVPQQPGIAEPLFLDPACEQCAVGQLSGWVNGREALILSAKQKVLDDPQIDVTFAPIVGGEPLASVERRTIEARLDGAGALDGAMTIERQGRSAVDSAIRTRSWQRDRWQKGLESTAQARHKTARLGEFTPQTCDKRQGRCSLRFAWSAPGYAVVDGERLVVPLAFLTSSWDKERPAGDEERQRDVFFRRPERDEEVLRVRVPDGFVVEELPAPVALQSPPLEIALDVARDGDTVVVRRSVQTHAGQWSKSEYARVAEILQTFSSLRAKTFTLRRH
jgi:hypothetical protein